MNTEPGDDRTASVDVKVGTVFIVQMVVGTLGNVSLLSRDLFLHFSGCKTRSTDFILRHLTVANSLAIFSRGIPETLAAFGLEHFTSDIGCKLVFYVHISSRGVSFGSTCLLSVFQAIAISPRDWKWAEFKGKALKYLNTSTALCWVLQLVLSFSFAVSMTTKLKTINITNKIDFAYCSDPRSVRGLYSVSVALLFISDSVCLGLMLWASGSMVLILHRHKQRVRHIHRTNTSSRSAPETRATRSILVLVSVFVCFYIPSTIMHIYLTFCVNPSSFLCTLGALINGCFPAVCPFLLLSCGASVSRTGCVCCGRSTEPSEHNRKNMCNACFSGLRCGCTGT